MRIYARAPARAREYMYQPHLERLPQSVCCSLGFPAHQVCVCVCVCVWVCVYIYIYIYVAQVHPNTSWKCQACIRSRNAVRMYVCMYVCMYAYIRMLSHSSSLKYPMTICGTCPPTNLSTLWVFVYLCVSACICVDISRPEKPLYHMHASMYMHIKTHIKRKIRPVYMDRQMTGMQDTSYM